MADDLSKSSGHDRARINVDEEYELQHWSVRFGVTAERLKAVVEQVGDRAETVEQYLRANER
jgi:hypothetical protein